MSEDVALINVELVSIKLFCAEHPCESVTTTVYIPLERFDIFCCVRPLFQRKVYAPLPPETLSAMAPVAAPLQNGLVSVSLITIGGDEEIDSLNVSVFPFASLIVTE